MGLRESGPLSREISIPRARPSAFHGSHRDNGAHLHGVVRSVQSNLFKINLTNFCIFKFELLSRSVKINFIETANS